ncbi:MAG: hypothetical protein ACK56I_25570 [bacterium]
MPALRGAGTPSAHPPGRARQDLALTVPAESPIAFACAPAIGPRGVPLARRNVRARARGGGGVHVTWRWD